MLFVYLHFISIRYDFDNVDQLLHLFYYGIGTGYFYSTILVHTDFFFKNLSQTIF